MKMRILTYDFRFAILTVLILLFCNKSMAGPPFNTDDPQPVDFRHWEYYVSSISTFQPGVWTGTSPHFEVNYGLVRNVQVHLLMPINYSYIKGQETSFGYADTELGVKYCFVQETDHRPQIGTFPIFEVPTVKNSEFSNGKMKVFLPIWIQKSWGHLTTYGGAGYWINPGEGNKNYLFSGWELQYDFSKVIMLGGELYLHTADTTDGQTVTGFNIGGSLNASDKIHFIFSVGHSLVHDDFTSSYLGLLLTI